VNARGRLHGTRSMYDAGCRCETCKEAKSTYHREYYLRWKLTPAYAAWRERLKLRLRQNMGSKTRLN
jgi:hypothetical protein